MRVAEEEKPWVQRVREGDLRAAHEEFQAHSRPSLIDNYVSTKLAARLGPLLIRFLSTYFDFVADDTGIDLSEEFFLFFKKVDYVGPRLLRKIVGYALTRRRVQVRATLWFGHWLAFQGRYTQAASILLRMKKEVPAEQIRLRGELFALIGNYHFVRGHIERADRAHAKAHPLLSLAGDKFFQMFNLGQWVRISAQKDDASHLDGILRLYDGMNPERPDERYGLRLLTYCAYVYHRDGNTALASQFYKSAERAYESSASELDRSIFKLMEAITFKAAGEVSRAANAMKVAREHLREYGTYRYLETLMDEIELHLTFAQKNNRLSRLLGTKYHRDFQFSVEATTRKVQTELQRDWYKSFFDGALRIYDQYEQLSIEELCSLLSKHCLADGCRHSEIEAETQPFLTFSEEEESCQFIFSLFLQERHHRIELTVPFKKWRNAEMLTAIRSMILSLQALGGKKREQSRKDRVERLERQNTFAAQVAHDIRSPLAALNVLMADLSSLPEEKRVLFRTAVAGIMDIANNLLSGERDIRKQRGLSEVAAVPAGPKTATFLLPSVVESIVSEKRLSARALQAVELTLHFDASAYGLFGRADLAELKRVGSNLIGNALEAVGANGQVGVSLFRKEKYAALGIRDNGRGIPAEILPKLFTRGFSHGKPGGNGLGLWHAKTTIEAWGGKIALRSEPGKGTEVEVLLPAEAPPKWFVPALEIPGENFTVAILDDDASVHSVWDARLKGALTQARNVRVIHFYSGREYIAWSRTKAAAGNWLLLTDYELLGEPLNGLDIVQHAGLDRSILVTSYSEDSRFLSSCERLGARLIPKSLAMYVPIQVNKGAQ